MADEERQIDVDETSGTMEVNADDDFEIIEIEGMPGDAPPPSAEDTGELESAGEPASEPADGGGGSRLEAVQEDLLRVRADFDNYRKRQAREKAEFMRQAASGLVEQLLPVLDNFRRAMAADEDTPDDAVDSYRDGVRMIYRQLVSSLEQAGLSLIETRGAMFDPNLHEAVARVETADVEPNTITEEIEPGYLFRDKLLKPARVCVAVAPGS